MTTFDYYSHKIALATKQVNDELEFLEQYMQYPDIPDYVEYLKGRIGKGSTASKYKPVNTNYKDMDLSEYNKDIDTLMFKKPWRNLNAFYKKMKLTQFIESLETNNKEQLLADILEGIKNKRFVANKNQIVYDQELMAVTAISCLVQTDDGYIIQWKK